MLYGKPWFKLHGHPLVGFAATKHHIALYVWSDTTLTRLSHLLDNDSTGESTIWFQLDNPLPEAVVHAIVNHRVTEILGSDR